MRWVLLTMLAACGDNATPCDFVEADDLGNATTAETTGLEIGGPARNLCGSVDHGHFDAALREIDADRFRVTLAGSGRLIVQLSGEADLAVIDDVSVRFFDTRPNPTLLAAGRFDPHLADHGVFLAEMPPGDYDVVVAGHAGGDTTGPLSYRVQILAQPDELCSAAPAVVYPEHADGMASTSNDVVDVDFMRDPMFQLTDAMDAPEATSLAIAPSQPEGVTGKSAATGTGPYVDRDTFAFTTDASTNELTIRLAWEGLADLDFVVFDPSTLVPVGASTIGASTLGELATFAIKPATPY